jgi:hypothetical protein
MSRHVRDPSTTSVMTPRVGVAKAAMLKDSEAGHAGRDHIWAGAGIWAER